MTKDDVFLAALTGILANSKRLGYDRRSDWEPLSSNQELNENIGAKIGDDDYLPTGYKEQAIHQALLYANEWEKHNQNGEKENV